MHVALVGAGYWKDIVLEAVRVLPGLRVARVWSRTADRAEQLAAELTRVQGEACLGTPDPVDFGDADLVILATPPALLPDLLGRAIAAGRPTLVEKPVSLDVDVVRQLDRQAAAAGVPVRVHLQGRFVPVMHAVREAVRRGRYGALREVDVQVLGNRNSPASPVPHGWQHRRELGGGVLGVSGPHAAEFVHSLAGPGTCRFAAVWTELSARRDAGGQLQPCTAEDNAVSWSEHPHGVHSRIRIGNTSRKHEELWTARCDGGTLRVSATARAVLLDNHGIVQELPAGRDGVLRAHELPISDPLFRCSERSFPSLAFLAAFLAELDDRQPRDLPTLGTLVECLPLLGPVGAGGSAQPTLS